MTFGRDDCGHCGEPHAAWYEGPDFVTAVASPEEVRSHEARFICAACARLVAERDLEGFVLRAFEYRSAIKGYDTPINVLRDFITRRCWF
jgi:hypothetical protein